MLGIAGVLEDSMYSCSQNIVLLALELNIFVFRTIPEGEVIIHMWTTPACKGFLSIVLAAWSGAVICPALLCGACDRWP